MREVILYMSLDGIVSDCEHPGVAISDAEAKQWKLEHISKAGAHLMGRVTYEEMSSYWPHSDDPYAAPMNDIPKIVFAQNLRDSEATWPVTRVARGDLGVEIAAIKAEPGADVVAWGGAKPLVLGRGQALFDQLPQSRHPNLVESKAFPSGIVAQVSRPQLGGERRP